MPLTKLLSKFKNFDTDKLFKDVFDDPRIKKLIISLNTDDPERGQLFALGIDSRGVSLKTIGGSRFTASGYSPFTIEEKKKKGQRTDHITLLDKGIFYKTFRVDVKNGEAIITANPNRGDTDLFKEWGEDIVGLTDESIQIVIDEITQRVRQLVLDRIIG